MNLERPGQGSYTHYSQSILQRVLSKFHLAGNLARSGRRAGHRGSANCLIVHRLNTKHATMTHMQKHIQMGHTTADGLLI